MSLLEMMRRASLTVTGNLAVMETEALLDRLGYRSSPFFLRGGKLFEHPGYSHFFRKARGEAHRAKKSSCSLVGVYALRQPAAREQYPATIIPTVYVCQAESEQQAAKIHGRVWNQNIVPYLVVNTPKSVRLYSGFEYDRNQPDETQVLEIARDANEILKRLSEVTADSIDSGEIWRQRKISTERRVDRSLLANLDRLSEVLTKDYGLALEHAHSLIGKYIYLKYLKDRGILSDWLLRDAEVREDEVYSTRARRDKLYQLETFLDGFLNGSVFPLPRDGKICSEHIRKVAGVFKGDDPNSGQQVLFDVYDFSYVAIETLSAVYQQFLREKGERRSKGAYYTPVHIVNLMLDELEVRRPLVEGTTVFDPSCGSGAFLVQCYRRLVEKVLSKEGEVRPARLGELLVKHIFGLDADAEACRVAQLSLSLTLLDYIDPPDLSKTKFNLPNLDGRNIFHCEGGFFDEDSAWARSTPVKSYGWVVGNPPWKKLTTENMKGDCDRKALEWMRNHSKAYPVGKQEVAEAFAWKASEMLSEGGQCGLVMPALSLFNKYSRRFRREFFSNIDVWCVVNFANIRRYLFEDAINPAAAFFFSGEDRWDKGEHYITTYAPFAVEQPSLREQEGTDKKIWAVFVNYASIMELPLHAVEGGSSLPWKIAMWGTPRDAQCVRKAHERYGDLREFLRLHGLTISEGLQLRDTPEKGTELINEVQGKNMLVMDRLKGIGVTHGLSKSAFQRLPKARDIYVRKGRKDLPLIVCKAPHIFVDECRRLAIYSKSFFVVPARQIGIAGDQKQQHILKALALYLKSDVAYYLQFWSTAKMGVERDVFTLEDLNALPVPLFSLSATELAEWAKLHDEIVKADAGEKRAKSDRMLWDRPADVQKTPDRGSEKLDVLIRRMNERVCTSMGIGKKQWWLIDDMLDVRIKLNDGAFSVKKVVKAATEKEIEDFARIFQEELDSFLDETKKPNVHQIKVLYGERSAVMIVEHLTQSKATKPEAVGVEDDSVKQELKELEARLQQTEGRVPEKPASQWMYFRRCLRVYEGRRTYIFKPRERVYWLKSQALAEADEFIAEKVSADS